MENFTTTFSSELTTSANATEMMNYQNISTADDAEALLMYRLAKTTEVLAFFVVIIVMFSMGCTMTLWEVWKHLKPPTGVIIGMISQFVLLPAGAFGLAHAMRIESTYALGVLLLGTCPGGSVSNVFTYWMNGDVTLSIVMTTVSTLVALGMMPLNLFIYSRSWTTLKIAVPYKTIILGLFLMLIPISIGMAVRWKWKEKVKIITKVGSAFTIVMIYSIIGMRWRMRPSWIWESPPGLYIAAALQNPVGWFLGYVFAIICRQSSKVSRTIAIETGTQNVAICMTVIIYSFPQETMWTIMAYPMTAGILQMVELTTLTAVWKIYRLIKRKFFSTELGEGENKGVADNENVQELGKSHKAKEKSGQINPALTIESEDEKALDKENPQKMDKKAKKEKLGEFNQAMVND